MCVNRANMVQINAEILCQSRKILTQLKSVEFMRVPTALMFYFSETELNSTIDAFYSFGISGWVPIY